MSMDNTDVLIQLQTQVHVLSAQYVQRRLIDFNELACDTCYKSCVTTPGKSISYSENSCIKSCHSNFLDVRRIVTKEIVATMNKNNE